MDYTNRIEKPLMSPFYEIYSITQKINKNTQDLTSRISNFFKNFFKQIKVHETKSRSQSSPLSSRDIELKEIRVDHPRIHIDDTESIIYHQQSNKYIHVSKAPAIKNLVISGGGAKGIILPGVIKAFEDSHLSGSSFRDQLENISGSSVGAMTACLVAAGLSADDLIKKVNSLNFKKLLGKGIIFKDGQPLLNFLKTTLKESVESHLKQICGVNDLNDVKDLKSIVIKQLIQLGVDYYNEEKINTHVDHLEKVIAVLKNNDSGITFGLLQGLHDFNPKIFKNLTVTAVCRENGKLFYFDAEKTPHLDIALACRASSSIPVILKHVRIESKFLMPGYVDELKGKNFLTFVDGGYLDNIPVASMQNKQLGTKNRGEQNQNLQTLALVFDTSKRSVFSQSPFHNVHSRSKPYDLYNPTNLIERLIADIFAKKIAKVKVKERHTLRHFKNLKNIQANYTQRNISLRITIGITDFKKAKKLGETYLNSGYHQAQEYLKVHHNELLYRQYDSLDALLENMEDEKKQSLDKEIKQFRMLTQS